MMAVIVMGQTGRRRSFTLSPLPLPLAVAAASRGAPRLSSRQTEREKSLHMYELHARAATAAVANAAWPGSRSRYQKYCRRAAAGRGAEGRRPRAGMQAAEQTVRWQRLFVANAIFTRCVVCVCVSLSLSLSLSHRSRRFRPTLARWLLPCGNTALELL